MIVHLPGFYLFPRLLFHWSFLNTGCILCIWLFLLPKQSLVNQTPPSVTTLWMAATSQCKSPDYTDINKCLIDISIVTSLGPCKIRHAPLGKHTVLQPCSSVSYPPHFILLPLYCLKPHCFQTGLEQQQSVCGEFYLYPQILPTPFPKI